MQWNQQCHFDPVQQKAVNANYTNAIVASFIPYGNIISQSENLIIVYYIICEYFS